MPPGERRVSVNLGEAGKGINEVRMKSSKGGRKRKGRRAQLGAGAGRGGAAAAVLSEGSAWRLAPAPGQLPGLTSPPARPGPPGTQQSPWLTGGLGNPGP